MDKKLKNEKMQVELKVSNSLSVIENMFLEDKANISKILGNIEALIDKLVSEKKYKLEKLVSKIDENNPLAILKKGYAKVTNKSEVLSSLNNVSIGDEVVVQLKDGKFIAEVKDIQGE